MADVGNADTNQHGDGKKSTAMIGLTIYQSVRNRQLCDEGLHAWVPWLDIGASWVTWCARTSCDHTEQWDA